uniref:RNA-directed DNA polymerase, eukaryota n=1 Tax=Tanacetum cinerariifolium TaxID=118510 RepID=A0A6L2LIZ7_TANCI|nr:RNA-directed DNA polymerase, eukaryota [Tanacetum cinerariifolium]
MEYSSEDDSCKDADENNANASKEVNRDDDSDVEGVSDTIFGNQEDISRKNLAHNKVCDEQEVSSDPFELNDLIKNHGKCEIASGKDSNIQFPPSFTPDRVQFHSPVPGEHRENASLSQHVNVHVSPVVEIKTKKGGSVLEVLDGIISVGQAMGFNMEGCINDMESIIETKMDSISEMDIKAIWGNYRFEYVLVKLLEKVLLISIYAPQSTTGKRMLWDYISSLVCRWNGLCMVMGDFNEVRRREDRSGSIFNVQDHRPILLREVFTDYGPSPFRFYHSWFSLAGFDQMVFETWNNIVLDDRNVMIWISLQGLVLALNGALGFADVYNMLRLRAIDAGIFKGLNIGTSFTISHLFYADDAVFIEEWSNANLSGITKILQCFSLLSGLKINLLKSHLFGFGLPSEVVYDAAENLGCSTMKTPFKYLGVMVGGNCSKVQAWDDTISKVKARLSIGSSKPYRLEITIIREVFRIKDCGVDLLSHCHLRVGNGLRTKFWKDLWIGDTRLCALFPRIYALETGKDCLVAEKLHSVSASLCRAVRGGAEASQLDLLQESIQNVILSNMDNRWT